jgi:histidine ammonia-lyase
MIWQRHKHGGVPDCVSIRCARSSTEGKQAIDTTCGILPFDPDIQEASGQPGQRQVAARIRALVGGSGLVDSAPMRVQDAYSLRCTPQVLGPVVDAVVFARERFTVAINAVEKSSLPMRKYGA